MALQLDAATLALMFITLAMTSVVVMFLIWRINRDVPGVLCWMAATLLNTATAVAGLLSAINGWDDGWPQILSATLSLAANMLVLEGALRFRGYESGRRWQIFLMLIPVFIVLLGLYRFDPAAREIFHDVFTAMLQILAGITLLWRTSGRHEFQANLLAAVAGILVGMIIGWRLLAVESGSEAMQWYLFAGVNLHVAWIFGLSVACYFRSRQQVMLLAREDSLTGLPNRRWIDERLSEALAEAQRSGDKFAVIMLDINEFKQVNDKFGHSAGDRVLIEVAKRLQNAVRESDFAGRLGGDEFIILARRMETDALLIQMVERIRTQLNGNMTLDDHKIDINVSIGTAVYPANGRNKDVLLGAADASMYQEKKRHQSKTTL